MLWLETQSTFVIGILVFGFCYLLATVTLCGALMFSRRAVAPSLTRVSEMMMPLVVILGLLFGFLAARVWENLDRANQLVGREAGALREIVLLAGSLPPDVRASVRQAVQRHIHLIESEEWPAMARGRATLGSIAEGLVEAMTVLLYFNPEQFNQQLVQQRTLVAIEQALEARRNRVLLSQAEIAPVQWGVIHVLATLILVTIALGHIDRRLVMAVNVFIFSTALALCLVLLVVHDRPFGGGGFTVSPTVLRAVVPN